MQKPVIITRGLIVYPGLEKTISVGREKSINAINLATVDYNNEIIIVPQIDPELENPKSQKDAYEIGTLCKITNINKKGEDDYTVTLKGIERIKLTNLQDKKIKKAGSCFYSDYQILKFDKIDPKILKDRYELLLSLLKDAKVIAEVLKVQNLKVDQLKPSALILAKLVYAAAHLNESITLEDSELILAQNDINKAADIVGKYYLDKKLSKEIDSEILEKINKDMSKQQREFYLRQKLGVIKDQLGEISSTEGEIKSLKKQVESKPYPEYIKKRVLEEIGHMEASINSQENAITRSYVEWLLCLPYWQKTTDNNDIVKVEASLNKTHYGLEKVKERIIEYLAVKAKSPKSKSPIICLVGPPGVGKSTLAKSIADALNKKFVQMSLGGVYDESEIRGHRKTYLGSMPGRIIKGLKKAGVTNPLFLLDEVDKLSADRLHGDPSSALLEVLDPEQNNRFIDNYIEEPYDLSDVMFVATANYADQIPEPLYDRLEIIELTSYTELEKLHIAKEYQIPKVLNQSGLKPEELRFTDEAISYIINRYTKEAGVRELERLINKITRKYIVKVLHHKNPSNLIDVKAVHEYLDKEIYEYNTKEEMNIPGVVNGMAYTSAGGDLLPIEVTHYPGKGEIVITGNLKETMKESANVALDYVKANAKKFGLENFKFKDYDIHIHVPQGGIPKDGPSAGVTLTTAIISSLSNRSVPNTIAMTGEITLRGRVLIIGGIKEKVISAYRGGVNEIYIPEDDERFLKDVPNEVRDKIKFHLVKTYTDIYQSIFHEKN